MSDRLAELRRQRALVREHLAWLDREIAHADESDHLPAGFVKQPAPAAAIVAAVVNAGPLANSVSSPAAESFATATAADAILSEYRVPAAALKSDVRKGCLIYFAAAFALVAAGVAILYFALRRN